MACESYFAVATQVMSSVFPGGGFFSDISVVSIGRQTNFLRSFYPTYDCATLESVLGPFFNQPQPANTTYAKQGGTVNLSNVESTIQAVGNASFPNGIFRINLLVELIDGSTTDYGYWEINWNFNGVTTDYVVTNLTTYPAPEVVMGDENSGVSSVQFLGFIASGSIPFQIIMETPATQAVQTITDGPGYLGCIIPACAVTPPPSDPVSFNPSVGLRCANFSKVVNPFGFQRGK